MQGWPGDKPHRAPPSARKAANFDRVIDFLAAEFA
jgi:hypothetical protein